MTYTVTFGVADEASSCRFESFANAKKVADALNADNMPAKITDDDHNVVYDDTTSDDDIIDV